MKFTKRKKKRNTRYSREYREEMRDMMWREIGRAKIHGAGDDEIDAIVTATDIMLNPVGRKSHG